MSHVFFLCRYTEFAPRFPLASRNKNQIALTYHGLTPAKTGRCKAFCLLCYQKKLFFHFIRKRPGLLVRKSSKSTAEPHIRRKNFRSVTSFSPFNVPS